MFRLRRLPLCAAIKREDEPSLSEFMPFPPLHDAHGTSLFLLLLLLLPSLFYCTCGWFMPPSLVFLFSFRGKSCQTESQPEAAGDHKVPMPRHLGGPATAAVILSLSASLFNQSIPFLRFPFLPLLPFFIVGIPIHISHSDGNPREGRRTSCRSCIKECKACMTLPSPSITAKLYSYLLNEAGYCCFSLLFRIHFSIPLFTLFVRHEPYADGLTPTAGQMACHTHTYIHTISLSLARYPSLRRPRTNPTHSPPTSTAPSSEADPQPPPCC